MHPGDKYPISDVLGLATETVIVGFGDGVELGATAVERSAAWAVIAGRGAVQILCEAACHGNPAEPLFSGGGGFKQADAGGVGAAVEYGDLYQLFQNRIFSDCYRAGKLPQGRDLAPRITAARRGA